MGKSQPLNAFANITLDSNGNGTVQIGPLRVREHWQPTAVYVEASTNVKEAIASLFVGSTPVSSQQFSQTETGSSGDTCSMGGIDMQTGQYLICQWVGGDVGALATMRVIGTYSIGAPE